MHKKMRNTTMSDFREWDRKFRDQDFYAFNNDNDGLLWLKVRAVSRSRQMREFLVQNNLTLEAERIREREVELFQRLRNMDDAIDRLDSFLRDLSNEWYNEMGIDVERLKDDLYKVRQYSWGGDRSNSLDKYLVDRYVKVISDYDALVDKGQEIAENSWKYVQTSWYNNWSSYLIESLFKRHKRVVSAVGEIKSVDFFIDGYPIDLKVTFFPNQYLEEKIKERRGMPELTWLKQEAMKVGVTTDNSFSKSQQEYSITEKLSELGHMEILDDLRRVRKEVVLNAMNNNNSIDLMTWLYSHQGERRFGAENRLYIILVDLTDIRQSWKMKRAFALIEPCVKDYLDHFNEESLKRIEFSFNERKYRALSDVIFVIKDYAPENVD